MVASARGHRTGLYERVAESMRSANVAEFNPNQLIPLFSLTRKQADNAVQWGTRHGRFACLRRGLYQLVR